jgi:hypothetical protein
MNRRSCIHTALTAVYVAPSARAAETPRHIEFYCDLAVTPGREDDMLENFETPFRSAAKKQPGHIDLKMLSCAMRFAGMPSAARAKKFADNREHAER